MVDTETGELQERRLKHPNEAESFYQELVSRPAQVLVGMEASGHVFQVERNGALFGATIEVRS